jgi:hypothetical protein
LRPPPQTVIFSFLSRPDATSLAERRKGDGHMLDSNGRVIDDPSANPSANVFEADPNLNFEKWGEYWRKVHGVRFVYAEDPDDHSLDHLLRYDQIHRIPAGPSSKAPLPYEVLVDADGKLHDTIIGHIPPHVRPRWDGVAYLTFDTPDHIGKVFGTDRVQNKIGPEDRTMFRDVAPILSRQFVLVPSDRIDAVSLVKTHVRRPELNRDTFQRHWLAEHADTVLAQQATRTLVGRYVQLHNVGGATEGEAFFYPETSAIDAVTLMSFSNMNDLEAYLLSEGHAAIMKSEERFSLTAEAEYWSALNFNIVQREAGERPTARPDATA